MRSIVSFVIVGVLVATNPLHAETAKEPATENKELRVLFVGNSFTHRGGMPNVVAELAKAGNPELRFEHLAFGGSGASIQHHWGTGTGTALGLITLASLTKEEREKTLKSFRDTLAKDPDDAMAENGLRIFRILLRHLRADANYRKWDFVALQKYEATDGYMEYAEKFAAQIKARGGRSILYVTTPHGGYKMNAKPLAEPPGPDVVWNDAKVFAEFANRIDAAVVPMPAVALHCNRVRPDLTLRWVNDGHPNQTMAYLTACTFYAAMFDRSPEGLPVDSATDFKAFEEGKDADGGPLTRTFSEKDRADLQRIAWESYSQFQQLRKGEEQ